MKRATMIAVEDGQFVKLCLEVRTSGQRLHSSVPLGVQMPVPRRPNRNSFTNVAVSPGKAAPTARTVTWLDREALVPVSRDEAAALVAPLFTSDDCYRNPFWRLLSDGKYWLIDTITLIERCLIPNPWLLPSLLTMFRTELARVMVSGDLVFLWATFKPLYNNVRLSQAWSFVHPACSIDDVSALIHWLDHTGRASELDLLASSIRKGRTLHLPSAWPVRRAWLDGVNVGGAMVTSKFDLEPLPAAPWRSAYVVTDETPHGLVFTSPALPAPLERDTSDHGSSQGWITGFIPPDATLRLKRGLAEMASQKLLSVAADLGLGTPNSHTRPGTEALVLKVLSQRDDPNHKRNKAIVRLVFRTEAPVRFIARLRVAEALTPAGALRSAFTVGSLSFAVEDRLLREAVEEFIDELLERARSQRPSVGRPRTRYRGLDPKAPLFANRNGEAYPDGVRNVSQGPGLALVLQRFFRRAGLRTNYTLNTRQLRGARMLHGFKRGEK